MDHQALLNLGIIDPLAKQITLLAWVEGLYEARIDHPSRTIHFTVLQDLALTVDRILAGK